MLKSLSNIAKKFAPADVITKEHQAVMAAQADLDSKIAAKKVELTDAGVHSPGEVQRLANELNALETQRVVNEKAAAALASGVSAALAAERSAARAAERAVIEKENEIAKANVGKYVELAKQTAAIVEHLARTEQAVFRFNLELADGEQPIVSAEVSLNRYPLPALHHSVSLPAVDPAAEPFRAALSVNELQGEAIAREAMLRKAVRKQIAGRAAQA